MKCLDHSAACTYWNGRISHKSLLPDGTCPGNQSPPTLCPQQLCFSISYHTQWTSRGYCKAMTAAKMQQNKGARKHISLLNSLPTFHLPLEIKLTKSLTSSRGVLREKMEKSYSQEASVNCFL